MLHPSHEQSSPPGRKRHCSKEAVLVPQASGTPPLAYRSYTTMPGGVVVSRPELNAVPMPAAGGGTWPLASIAQAYCYCSRTT